MADKEKLAHVPEDAGILTVTLDDEVLETEVVAAPEGEYEEIVLEKPTVQLNLTKKGRVLGSFRVTWMAAPTEKYPLGVRGQTELQASVPNPSAADKALQARFGQGVVHYPSETRMSNGIEVPEEFRIQRAVLAFPKDLSIGLVPGQGSDMWMSTIRNADTTRPAWAIRRVKRQPSRQEGADPKELYEVFGYLRSVTYETDTIVTDPATGERKLVTQTVTHEFNRRSNRSRAQDNGDSDDAIGIADIIEGR